MFNIFYLYFAALIIFFIFFLTIVFIYILWIRNSIKYGIPQVWTYNSDFILIRKYFDNLSNHKWKRLIDLWSWTWWALRFFEKHYWMKTVWYEVDLWNFLISKFLNNLFKCKSEIFKKNLNNVDLSGFDYIYLYLFPEFLANIEDSIFRKAKKWTIIITNSFQFSKNKAIEIIKSKKWKDRIFIYKV